MIFCMLHAPLGSMGRWPLPLSPPFPLAGLPSWASAEGGQVQRAGLDSWVELVYAADFYKSQVEECPWDIRVLANLSPGKAGPLLW